MEPELEKAVSLGNSLSCSKEMISHVYEKVSSLSLAFSHVKDLQARR